MVLVLLLLIQTARCILDEIKLYFCRKKCLMLFQSEKYTTRKTIFYICFIIAIVVII